MASRIGRASMFALALAVRAVLIGGLAWGAIELVARAHYYATALVLAGLAVLVAVDLARSVTVADRMLKTFADGLAAGAVDRPARPPGRWLRPCPVAGRPRRRGLERRD